MICNPGHALWFIFNHYSEILMGEQDLHRGQDNLSSMKWPSCETLVLQSNRTIKTPAKNLKQYEVTWLCNGCPILDKLLILIPWCNQLQEAESFWRNCSGMHCSENSPVHPVQFTGLNWSEILHTLLFYNFCSELRGCSTGQPIIWIRGMIA